jgi:hypothetical protein
MAWIWTIFFAAVDVHDNGFPSADIATEPTAWRNGRKEAPCINTFTCFANHGFGDEPGHLARALSGHYSELLETLLRCYCQLLVRVATKTAAARSLRWHCQ